VSDRTKQPAVLIQKQRSHLRLPFVLGACLALWLFGLNRGHFSILQLALVAGAGVFALVLVAARRTRVDEPPEPIAHPPAVEPHTCVIVQLGEVRNRRSVTR
jgi:hypothetical protein